MPTPQTQNDLPKIRLDSLKTLSLHVVSSAITQANLTRIQAPILQHLTIQPRYKGAGNNYIVDAIQNFLPMIHPSIKHANVVDLHLGHYLVDIRTPSNLPDPHASIDISIYYDSSARTVQTFLDNTIHSSASHTPIRLSIPESPTLEWSDLGKILGFLDEVVKLSTGEIRSDPLRNLFQFLSTPLDAFGRKKWPFPNLKTIVFPSNS
ncbi:hypothetical protein FS837_008125 [Tulasnella sp. UAMH 9824]|nr:hypothetical protein FS837_008125 [Tulasnella sp. UAMH 9824]